VSAAIACKHRSDPQRTTGTRTRFTPAPATAGDEDAFAALERTLAQSRFVPPMARRVPGIAGKESVHASFRDSRAAAFRSLFGGQR
jgi:hypothetical protein